MHDFVLLEVLVILASFLDGVILEFTSVFFSIVIFICKQCSFISDNLSIQIYNLKPETSVFILAFESLISLIVVLFPNFIAVLSSRANAFRYRK